MKRASSLIQRARDLFTVSQLCMNVEIIEVNEWQELLKLEPEFGGRLYRGQADANWPLTTSLARTVEMNNLQYGYEPEDILYGERGSLRTFRSRAHFYLDSLPPIDDHVAWLALMQHHGTPTRLLDFTQSIYVAVYFALINSNTECCVWSIDDGWLRDEGVKIAANFNLEPSNTLRYGGLRTIYEAANKIVEGNSFDDERDSDFLGVLMIDLERQIPRASIQQGVFLMPTKLGASFEENLFSLDASEYSPVQKIVFKPEIRNHALMHLRSMNITAETLFPGIDGFARSLIQQDIL